MGITRVDRAYPLFGREAELEAVREALVPGAAVVVHGPPGIGKTALIRRILTEHEHGLRVDLTDARTGPDLASALARELPATLSTPSSVHADLARALPPGGVVALDSAERLSAEAWDCVAALRALSPTTCWIVGTVIEVPCSGRRLALGPLSVEASRALLIARASQVDLLRRIDTADPVWDDLVERLEGLPLALSLAASRLALAPPAAVLAHLDSAVLNGTDRRTSVEGAVRFAWELLGPEERDALVALSPAAGGFELWLAQALLGERAYCMLEALRARSAVVHQRERLFVLRPLRRIAMEVAGDEVRRAFVHVWVHKGRELREQARGAAPALGFRGLVDEQDNLFAAVRLARDVAPEHGASIATAALASLRAHGPLARLDSLGDPRGLAAAASAEDGAEMLAMWGGALRDLGDPVHGEALLVEALERAPPGQSRARNIALAELGWLALVRQELGEARWLVRAAIEAADDGIGVALALNRLAAIELTADNRAAASDAWVQALEHLRATPSPQQQGVVHLNLALLRAEQGRLVEAIDLANAACAETAECDRAAHAAAHVVLSLLHGARGDSGAAREVAWRGLSLHRAHGHRRTLGLAHMGLALAHWLGGDLDAARVELQQARGLLDGVDPGSAAGVRAWRAALEAHTGNPSGLKAELAAAREAGADPHLVDVLEAFGGAPVPELREEHPEVQIARRLVSTSPPALAVERAGRWFSWPGHRADLSRRGALQRMLAALVERRLAAPGTGLTVTELFEAGWPGERALAEAAASRVYTAIRTLRALGLGEVLKREAQGYVLDPVVPVQLIDQPTPTASVLGAPLRL